MLSKICRLNAALEPSLISDVPSFLTFVTSEIDNDLKEINKKNLINLQKKQIIAYKKDYENHLSPKIQEANHFIKLLGEEVKETNKKLNDHIQNLMLEIQELKKSKQEEQKALLQKQEELRRMMPLKMLFNVLSVGTKALGFLGESGNMVSGLLDAGLGISQGFLPSSSEQDRFNAIPEGVNHMIREVKEYIGTQDNNNKNNVNIEERFNAQALYFNQRTGEWMAFKASYDGIQNHQIKEDILKGLETDVKQSSSSQEKLKKALEKAQVAVNVAKAGVELYNTYKSDQSQMDELSKAIEANKEDVKKLTNYEKKVSEEFTPYVEKVKKAVQGFQGNLKDKSTVSLDVQKWNVKKYLMDVQYEVQKLTKGFAVANEFKLSFEKMEGALKTVIQLYERIQNFQDQMTFARYTADLAIASLPALPEKDTTLQLVTSKLEKVISYNIIMEQYAKVINAVKHWTFPFSSFFIESLEILENNDSLNSMVEGVSRNLKKLNKNVQEFGVTIHSTIDKALHESEFRRDYQASHSFFTWDYNKYPTAIENLLQGNEVILKADLPTNALSVLKFDEIELELSHKDIEKNARLQEMLKNYDVTLTHWGHSDYKYGDYIYKVLTGKFSIEYSFEKYPYTHKPIRRNEVYNKLQRGKPVLSPYAFWSIHIKKSPKSSCPSVDELYINFKDFLAHIDLHLVGHGWYVDETMISKDLKIDEYYVRE